MQSYNPPCKRLAFSKKWLDPYRETLDKPRSQKTKKTCLLEDPPSNQRESWDIDRPWTSCFLSFTEGFLGKTTILRLYSIDIFVQLKSWNNQWMANMESLKMMISLWSSFWCNHDQHLHGEPGVVNDVWGYRSMGIWSYHATMLGCFRPSHHQLNFWGIPYLFWNQLKQIVTFCNFCT